MRKLLSMDLLSRRIEAHRETVLALYARRRDIPLDELRRGPGQAGVTAAISTLHRFFSRHGITRKKTGHAIEQDRADFLSAREGWSMGNSTSTLRDWCSPTKPGRRPT